MQKQRSNKDAPLTGKTAQGNPDAASAVRKAKDALAAIDAKPPHPLGFEPVDPRHIYGNELMDHGVDINSMLYVHRQLAEQKGGLCCYCGVRYCNIGPFFWRN